MDDDRLCTMILAAAFRVHSRLGPGLLESVYFRVLGYELTKGSAPRLRDLRGLRASLLTTSIRDLPGRFGEAYKYRCRRVAHETREDFPTDPIAR